MPTIETNSTLAELVITHPELAPRLDGLGLDYCCGGQRSLTEAVDAAGLDLEVITAQLQSTPPAALATDPEWDGIDGLADHLETTHHAYLREVLPRVTALADKVANVHGSKHSELVTVAELVHEIRADLEPHLLREEQVLFPMIRELAGASAAPTFHCGSLVNPIKVMLAEHDRVGELLAELRGKTDQYRVPDDGCASYQALYTGLAEFEADTHVHVHKENNILFPAVLEIERELAAVTS